MSMPVTEPDELAPLIGELAQPGDMVVCLGAGSITHWANSLPDELARWTPARESHDGRMRIADGRRWPPVRGRLTAERAARPADLVRRRRSRPRCCSEPADCDDLAAFLAALAPDIPVTVIGGGSNLLVRDGGIPGVTIRLGRGFAGIVVEARNGLRRRRGARSQRRAGPRPRPGIAGLEFLSRHSRHDRRRSADECRRLWPRDQGCPDFGDGARPRRRAPVIDRAAMRLSYRHCAVAPDWIFVAARLRAAADERAAIAKRMAEIRAAREATQPIRARTGGSTFANPPGDAAWQLIDAAGCRGLVRGGAMVSPKHANFLINTGGATAADLEGAWRRGAAAGLRR